MLTLSLIFCVLAASASTAQGADGVRGFLETSRDGQRFERVFQAGFETDDLSSLHYGVRGLKYLKKTAPAALCQKAAKLSKDSTTVEQSYYAAATLKALGCKETFAGSDIAKNVLSDTKSTTADLMYAVLLAKSSNGPVDGDALSKTLQEHLKKDDSVSNLAYVFHICSEIKCGAWATERMEDAIIQADEVDGRMLHWEGGLSVTASILTGILKLAKAEKKPSQITPEQAVKIANYLLSRKSVQTVKGVSVLLESLDSLAEETTLSPVCITLQGNGQISSSDQVRVTVSDLFGRPHPAITADSVQAQSVTRLQDNVVVLSKQKLVKDAKEPTSYSLDLMKAKPNTGLYKVAMSAGSSSGVVSVRVLGKIDIDSVEVGVGDVDGSSTSRLTSVAYPNKISQAFEADSLQKIIVKFALKEKGQTQLAKAHQTFVRIFSKSSDIEVIFVAEVDSTKVYKMDVDVGSVADKFTHKSGLYGVELIIGDAVISNPIRWIVADVNLKFATVPKETSGSGMRTVKPEISHLFREPDARPARVVSDVFTALCVAPILLLFILWFRIGINIKNFPFSLSALGFHLGLGSILGLFVVFWLRLTMFETIRYLLALGFITFICGNRLLRSIAAKRKRV